MPLVFRPLLIALLFLPLTAKAQEPRVTSEAAAAIQGPVSRQVLAQELARLGEAERDARMLLAAARLAASAPVVAGAPLERQRRPAGQAEAPPALAAEPPAPETGLSKSPAAMAETSPLAPEPVTDSRLPDSEQLYTRATALAGDDPALLAVIAATKAQPLPQLPPAAGYGVDLPPGMVDLWTLPLRANLYVEIAVLGDGEANLDMVLLDEDGNMICAERGPSDQILCGFVPARDGIFHLAIENTGANANHYTLLTN